MKISNKTQLIMELQNFAEQLTGYAIQDPDFNTKRFSPQDRLYGADYPSTGLTMIGVKRLINLQELLFDVIERDVPGDFLEAGVWRGGACIFAALIFEILGIPDRRVWVCDSFEGLPKPDKEHTEDRGDTHHKNNFLSVSLETVQDNFRRNNLLNDRVQFVKGWFKDTLHTIPANQLSIIRLDGDMYDSTIESLEALYPKLSPGGYVIIDDLGLKPCQQAVMDFRKKYEIRDSMILIEPVSMASYWKKS